MDDKDARTMTAAHAAADPAVSVAPPADRRSRWDFVLLWVTVALLGGLGVQSLIGTLYSWWATRATEGWADSPAYVSYVGVMDSIAAPMVIGLAVAMGLCIPKRLFSRTSLAAASVLMLLFGLGTWAGTGSATDGLAVYLLGAAGIQVAVVIMTIAGSGSPRFLSEGRMTRIGSGLLHLGFIIFGYSVVALQKDAWMLPVFWVGTVLALGGSALTFYADTVFRALRGASTAP